MNYIKHEDTNRKHYIDKDVYTAAKERLTDAILQSDSQVVLWSGGKDSTVCLHLLRECYNELDIHDKINVIFIDEEVISNHIIKYVRRVYDSHRYNMYWFNIPITCDIYNTGTTREYIQNDPHRKTKVRHPPPEALTLKDFNLPNDTILTRYQLADLQASLFHGKVCLIKGIRCDESLFRLTQVLRRKTHPHIGGGANTSKHFECVPIYDWKEKDIWTYFHHNNIQYNPIYNHLMWSKAPLRVSTPLHPYNTQQYNKLRSIEPEFYENIVNVFPDMQHADRYNNSKIQTNHDFTEYPHTLTGLMQYVDDCYKDDPQEKHNVKKRLLWAYKKREQNKKRQYSDKFGGYPLYHLFRLTQRGATMRNITPVDKPSRKMYTFEGYTEDDYIHDIKNRGKYNATNR